MTVKLLLPAYGKHGSALIGVGGNLRLVDRPKRTCHGYACGCVCPQCSRRAARRAAEREEQLPVGMIPKGCECDRPMGEPGSECLKCGKPLRLKAA